METEERTVNPGTVSRQPLGDGGVPNGAGRNGVGRNGNGRNGNVDGGESGDGVKKRRRAERRSPWMVVLGCLIAVALVGGAGYYVLNADSESEQNAYRNAMESTASVVLRSYLDIYKDAPSEHRDSVIMRMRELLAIDEEWDSTVVRNTRADYEGFISRYPGNMHIAEALMRIDSLDWQRAEGLSTLEAYQAYISAHPDGIFVDLAHEEVIMLDVKSVSEEDVYRVKGVLAHYFKNLAAKERPGGGLRVQYSLSDSLAVEKEDADSGFVWRVAFNVDKMFVAPNPANSRISSYKAHVKLTPTLELDSIKMEKL